jgi:hypothetical protein
VDRSQKTEDRSQKAEGRRQKAEGRRQKTEGPAGEQMLKAGVRVVLFASLMSACGSDVSPVTPTPITPTSTASSQDYEGEWQGTTLQGTPITFSISADQRVTTITVGYILNGCSISKTFSNLSLTIASPPPPIRPGPPGFGYGSSSPDFTNFIQVEGWFPTNERAMGIVIFAGMRAAGTGAPTGPPPDVDLMEYG